jgi:hypothetical protein
MGLGSFGVIKDRSKAQASWKQETGARRKQSKK